MGQPLPLPERVPAPPAEVKAELEKLGFQFEADAVGPYVPMELPSGYRWTDRSRREDLPAWYILNQEGKAIVYVAGAWKGTYDNELQMGINLDEGFDLPEESGHVIPSETSAEALLDKAAKAALSDTGRQSDRAALAVLAAAADAIGAAGDTGSLKSEED